MSDTIAAIATPFGVAGIGIVRLSGPEALDIVDSIFQGQGIDSLLASKSYQAHYGHIIHPVSKSIIDEVICLIMRGPKSFTREDVVEIDCHGGPLPVNRILELVLSQGARLAQQGEFTKRAFLNGRIDLSQAEAVMDIIYARTEEGMDLALCNLKGALYQKVEGLREEVVSLLAQIEAAIDFPEDEVPGFESREMEARLQRIRREIESLLETAHEGKIMREGIKTAIIGRPNVGKSSLLNALLGERRAIVTEIPGTTRDTIEEVINVKGIPLIIVDTAGIRETRDQIEEEGVLRSREYLGKAHLILLVVDVHEGIGDEEFQILEAVDNRPVILVLNKIDLTSKMTKKTVQEMFPGMEMVWTSLLEGTGITDLKEKIAEQILGGRVTVSEGAVVNRLRHINALRKALEAIKQGQKTLGEGLTLDLISIDLQEVGERLGEITGATLQEDVLDKIFSQFCLGK